MCTHLKSLVIVHAPLNVRLVGKHEKAGAGQSLMRAACQQLGTWTHKMLVQTFNSPLPAAVRAIRSGSHRCAAGQWHPPPR